MEDFEKPLKHSNFLQLQMEMQKSISKILDFYFICQNYKKGPIYLALKSKFLFFPIFQNLQQQPKYCTNFTWAEFDIFVGCLLTLTICLGKCQKHIFKILFRLSVFLKLADKILILKVLLKCIKWLPLEDKKSRTHSFLWFSVFQA